MNRRHFLTIAGSTFAAAVLLRVCPKTDDSQVPLPPPSASTPQAAKIYCGCTVNANGRFRHYLVDGRRVTERAAA